MRPLELRYGTVEAIALRLEPTGSSSPRIQQGDELAMLRDVHGDLVLDTGSGRRAAEPASGSQGRRVDDLIATNMPRVCTVIAVFSGAPEELVVEVRSFAHHVRLDRLLRLTFADGVADSIDEQGLREEFVLPAGAGTGTRVIVSAGPDPSDALTTSFQLHGASRNALVRADERDLVIYRLVTSHHGIDEFTTPVALVESPGFGVAEEPGTEALDVLLRLRDAVPQRQRYLELLERFIPVDKEQSLEKWDSFGALRYHDVTRIDREWYFRLEREPTDAQREVLAASKDLGLTAVTSDNRPAPGERKSDPPDGRPWPEDGMFAGEAHQVVGKAARQLDEQLELCVHADRLEEPPSSGELRLATRGTRVAWERRRWAFGRMMGGDGPPRLARLLGEMTGPPARRLVGRALHEKEIRRAFDGRSPTEGQRKAIEVAVNTPDVAIIHGPPGTGKTRVIHAVSTQLAARARYRATGEPPALLLTSHGQEAVRNVAENTDVFDMPAATLGLREDRALNIRSAREWADARLLKLEATGADAREAHRILYGLHREVAGYELAPTSPGETALLLNRILRDFDRHLSAATVSKLRGKADELQTAVARPSDDAELEQAVLRAVRGIRADATTWEDDGPERAEAAIAALRSVDLIAPEDEALLRHATVDELDPVGRLREALIDRLIGRLDAPLRPGVDQTVRELLRRALEEARTAVLRQPDGIPLIVAEYEDALRHDLPQVERLKRDYASLVATTCQRAQDSRLLSPTGERPRFETVIVDEAARASPLDLLIPLSGATRRVILVGDHRQLPHVLERELEDRLATVGDDDYSDLLRLSLFEHVRHAAEKQSEVDGVRRIELLDQQFRMHPRLGSLMNEVFYEPHGEHVGNGERQEPTHDIADFENRVAAWVDVPLTDGSDERRGKSSYRELEAKAVADQVATLRADHSDLSIGVIAFYRAQVEEILRELAAPNHALAMEGGRGFELLPSAEGKLLVGTVDAFQGREFDVVLLSVTRSNDTRAHPRAEKTWWWKWGHLRFPNRMCVALSRQRALLIAVGDRAMAADPVAERAVPGLWRFERLCREEDAAARA